MNININKWFILPVVALGAAFMTTSCEDEPDKYEIADGSPTIHYIRSVDIAKADSLLTGAYMDEAICLVGENLRSVVKVRFNDQPAALNTSLITDNTLIVNVPGEIPGEVFDKIFMYNNAGEEFTYDFKVLIPPPSISGMNNEWARAGEKAVVYGNYFIDDPNVPLTLTVNGQQIDIDDFTRTAITFTVPAGLEEGPVTIASVYGTTKAKFNYHDTTGMLFDNWGAEGEEGTGLTNHGWHSQQIWNDETSLCGSYLMLGNAPMSAEGGWADGNFSFEYWPGDWNTPMGFEGTDARLSDLVSFADFEKMAIKFEMNIPAANPWKAGAMQIIFSGDEQVTIQTANNKFFNGLEHTDYIDYPRALYRPWAATGSYDTNDEWVTVTVPIEDFRYRSDGTVAGDKLGASNFTGLTIFVWSGGMNGEDCTPIIKIDNIRAVVVK